MHIPDGFLDSKTIAATATLSLVGVSVAWQQTKREIEPQRIPLLGVTAAFVFAAQMLNFPVAGGTSGHLMGAVLSSVLLGPAASIITMTSVLIVQCFLFADGGVLSLGANVFNMAIIGSIAGTGVYRGLARIMPGERGQLIAVAIASWCSVVLASICCAGQLAWSGVISWQHAFPAMAGIHAVIGVGEAVISCLIILAVRKARPELLVSASPGSRSPHYGTVTVYGVVVAAGLVLFVSPFASEWPDGLERVAAMLGFDQRALHTTVVPGLISDYRFPGLESPTAATIVAGLVGVCIVFSVVYLALRMTRPSRQHRQSSPHR